MLLLNLLIGEKKVENHYGWIDWQEDAMKPFSPINELNDFIERLLCIKDSKRIKNKNQETEIWMDCHKVYNILSPSKFSDISKLNDFFESLLSMLKFLFSIKDVPNLREQ